VRVVVAMLLGASCTADDPSYTYSFGPYPLAPGEEVTDQCVSVTLSNDQPLYINQVELTTGPGFHHSNWFWVPDFQYPGPDGTWNCQDRLFDDGLAGELGGVVFAQSTQVQHEIQQFPDGAVTKIPPHAKLVAGTHLLNAGDTALEVPLTIELTPIAEANVTTILTGMSFENAALGIPAMATSRFTIECDIATPHEMYVGRPPDFSIYYALGHYHTLGIEIAVEALRDDGTTDTVYTTTGRTGDALGGPIDPPFSMVGHGKLRFSCTYDNPRDTTVGWGVGDQEMCVFLAFTDSTFTWAGGVLTEDDPGPGTLTDGIVEFIHSCQVIAADATH
jgi:hypothetical protein